MIEQSRRNPEFNINIDLPYPPVHTENRNLEYAYELLSNIGSDHSEMSTLSLYFYNSVILNPEYSEISQCYHKISIVEMHHLNIFATLCYQMGLNPRLWSMKNNKRYYWSPEYNNYSMKIKEIMENSIKEETSTIQKYTKQAEYIQDADIKKILERIIIDEQHHVDILQKMMKTIK